MASGRFVFAAFLLVAVVHVGSALQCFQCVEERGKDGICRDEHGTKHASTSCDHSCITHTLAPISFGGMESGEIVARVCTDPSYCTLGAALLEQKMGLKTRQCTSCDSNYCNSASTAIPSCILVAILAVKYYFL